MSQIITFYSYKGGVGRSMALANVATLLSKWGKKVLMIDWDLEAPGLENFFKEYLKDTDWKQQKGVLEWLYAQQNDEKVNLKNWVVKFRTTESKVDLHLLVSGKDNGSYSEMLRDFDVSQFYEKYDGGRRIEQLREELLAVYDYVLIDSRTGVTDFGGICTIQMPDIVVMLFSPTEQGLLGTKKIAQRMLEGHSKLPFERFSLLICPVPSRFDSTTEFQESRKWLDRIASELEELYDNWLPANIKLNEFLQIIKIPYISYFSFGEKLPVIEQGVSDPTGLGYAYENLAVLLGRGLDGIDVFVENRDVYLDLYLLKSKKPKSTAKSKDKSKTSTSKSLTKHEEKNTKIPSHLAIKFERFSSKGWKASAGYANRDFYIHLKNGNSFHVRKGNYLDWSDDKYFSITLTRGLSMVEEALRGSGGLWKLLEGTLSQFSTNTAQIEELRNSKNVKFSWGNIIRISL